MNKIQNKSKRNFFSPFVNVILYDVILVLTPFIMLMNFLQETVLSLSKINLNLFGNQVPFLAIIFIAVFIALIIVTWKRITIFRAIFTILCIGLWLLGQSSTDYYFNHNFYDLQHNWHYVAYGIFSFIYYRYLTIKGVKEGKKVLMIFITGIALSGFDEGFQYFLANRIFDICDIAKDGWGTVIGLIFIYFVIYNGDIIKSGWKIREKRMKDYIKNPFAIIVFELIFAYLLLLISSLLTDHSYILYGLLIPFSLFLIIFLIIHFTQNKIFRKLFIALCVILLITQSYFIIKNYNTGVSYLDKGFVSYKGVLIPYFDVMIYPDGCFRLVDKKIRFNKRDLERICSYSPDILVIGTGTDGKGGLGFNRTNNVQNSYFVFNSHTKRGMQLVLLNTPEACWEYNELIKRKKNVMFIIHNN